MRPEVEDIQWRDHFAEGIAEGARLSRAIVIKPTGQGYDPKSDDW